MKILENILQNLKKENQVYISKASNATLSLLAVEARKAGSSVVLLARNREELNTYKAFTQLFSPDLSEQVSTKVYQSHGTKEEQQKKLLDKQWVSLAPFTQRSFTRQAWAQRMGALYRVQQGQSLICTFDSLIPKYPPIDFFESRELLLKKGEEYIPDLLLEQFSDWGYTRVSMVANPGEMARRGDILDVYCPLYEKAIRIEFFGDNLEEMRFFDSQTQRSVEYLEEVEIIPVSPIRRNKQALAKMRERFVRLFQKGYITEFAQSSLFRALELDDPRLMPGVAYDAPTTLEEWLPKNTIWILPDTFAFEEGLVNAYSQLRSHLQEDGTLLDQNEDLTLRNVENVALSLENRSRIYAQDMIMGREQIGVELQERVLHSYSDLFPLTSQVERPWQQLMQGIKEWQKKYRQIILAFSSARGREKFLKLTEEEGLLPYLRYSEQDKGLYALVASCTQGAELKWDNVLILHEDMLQPQSPKTKSVPSGAFKGLDKYDELEPGDLLVHKEYGLGRFQGLFHLTLGGVANDFLLIEYSENAKLYIPVDRLSIIQRFKGSETPALDKLGSTAWSTSKDKVKKAIETIAADLVEMYALRKVAKGFTYSPLGDLYKEFEASFGFEETPDQSKAISDVLEDMEKPTPMDRLVCGDVGFGKTEVALRAAFRAACDGRQVVLLCPTTVLAEQHYQTFRSRLSGFAINVGLLSRFVTKSKQNEVIKLAAKGQIDILIGTHRLLSADVVLPNLGLLILDEEQRFGVRHKEKLKQLKKNVDCLTLTATPIPRTLQLSMSGIRELSVIETAPPERKPVVTALMNRDKNLLKDVVQRELAREGQVFWVHNRVMGLEKVCEYVKNLVPTARIGMAHGQMAEKELEETMNKFWHGELDVLVCTSIVESGLDFPRANTLIVDQAQMFGLGQLYQLRGRVGRSDRQAYAYFVASQFESLSDIARERMRIILELDYLGAGFQLAMEDLRLRGAGNILGEVQTGHITRIGLDLYLEMLEEAVAKLKGDELIRMETEVNIAIPAHIPESYIEDNKERLKYYKMLSSAPTSALREEIEREMKDRFGTFPEVVHTFLEILAIKEWASTHGVLKADIRQEILRFTFDNKQSKIEPLSIIEAVKAYPQQLKLFPPSGLEMKLDTKLALPQRLKKVRTVFALLTERKHV